MFSYDFYLTCNDNGKYNFVIQENYIAVIISKHEYNTREEAETEALKSLELFERLEKAANE